MSIKIRVLKKQKIEILKQRRRVIRSLEKALEGLQAINIHYKTLRTLDSEQFTRSEKSIMRRSKVLADDIWIIIEEVDRWIQFEEPEN